MVVSFAIVLILMMFFLLLALGGGLLFALARCSRIGAWVAALLGCGMVGFVAVMMAGAAYWNVRSASLLQGRAERGPSDGRFSLSHDIASPDESSIQQVAWLDVVQALEVAHAKKLDDDRPDFEDLLEGLAEGVEDGIEDWEEDAAAAPAAVASERTGISLAERFGNVAAPAAERQALTEESQQPRPAWLDEPPGRHGQAYRKIVHAGPHPRRLEAEHESEEAIRRAVAEYVDAVAEPGASERVELPLEYIRQAIVRDEYTQVQRRSFSALADDVYMVELYTLLEFGPDVRDEVRARYREAVIERRLWAAGLSVGGVLMLLGAALSVLRRPGR